MTPYYDHAGCTIYHGDCRDHLMLHADTLITDPPYGIGEAAGKNKSRGYLATAKDFGHSDWDDRPVPRWLLDAWIDLTRLAIIFGGNYYGLPASSCWLVWDKDNGASDFADCELAWTNGKGAVRRLRHRWQGMLQEHMGAAKEVRVHPTQKPVPVMKWVIRQPDVGSIVDPFMGSGTTLVAAKECGHSAIGIEIEEKYCEIAAKRLEQEVFDFADSGRLA